jgi:DNA repair photolyase
VRWDNLRLTDEPDPSPALPLFGRGTVTRHFDTPEFRGMTFYEVQARSIINRVPAASRMPFTWTINPYRGCSHACVYCLSGDTPILMGDERTKPLADVRVGDVVYGTRRVGSYRRYVQTVVLAHWQTVKPAHRVRLQDGTHLVASGDHRFLTYRGWKHVTGADHGVARRPHLTTNDEMLGLGAFGTAPDGGTAIKSNTRLRVASIEALGLELPMYDITTGTGDFVADGVISHNCFARNTHTYLDLDAGHDFDSKVIVKVNAPELLRRELAAPSWQHEPIAMGTNVDCYQRAEGRYQLMRGILAALRDAANPFSILTKGSLLLRDLDLLEQAAAVTEVGTAVSVGFLDRELWRAVEPGTPSPQKRLEVCAQLSESGIGCGVLMAPILPFLTDAPEQLEAGVRAAAAAGARFVTPIVLHLRPGAREWYLRWLVGYRPDLIPAYERLYGERAYAPRSYQRGISDLVAELTRAHRIGSGADHRSASAPARHPRRRGGQAEQLTML